MRIAIILAALTLALGCGKKKPQHNPNPPAKPEQKNEVKKTSAKPKVDPTKHERFLWEFEMGRGDISSPTIGSDGTVFARSSGNKLYALSGKNGVKLWEFETGGLIRSSPAIGSDGTIYVGSNDNKVIAKYKITNNVYEICELEI